MAKLPPPSAPPVEPDGRTHARADVEGDVWTCPCPDRPRSFIRRRNDFLDRLDAMLETTRRGCRAQTGLAG